MQRRKMGWIGGSLFFMMFLFTLSPRVTFATAGTGFTFDSIASVRPGLAVKGGNRVTRVTIKGLVKGADETVILYFPVKENDEQVLEGRKDALDNCLKLGILAMSNSNKYKFRAYGSLDESTNNNKWIRMSYSNDTGCTLSLK